VPPVRTTRAAKPSRHVPTAPAIPPPLRRPRREARVPATHTQPE